MQYETGPFENEPSISGAPQGPISGTPSRIKKERFCASIRCSTAKLQDTNGAPPPPPLAVEAAPPRPPPPTDARKAKAGDDGGNEGKKRRAPDPV